MDTAADSHVLIFSTAPLSEAEGIARTLVERRLVACVNITAVQSIYRWEGRISDEPERLLVIKTTGHRQGEVIAAIKELHSYALPEIIVLPIIGGYIPYLSWVRDETAEK